MKEKDFEGSLKRAKEIVDALVNPEISLNDGMKLYKEGVKELKNAEELLTKAKIEYQEIKKEIDKENSE